MNWFVSSVSICVRLWLLLWLVARCTPRLRGESSGGRLGRQENRNARSAVPGASFSSFQLGRFEVGYFRAAEPPGELLLSLFLGYLLLGLLGLLLSRLLRGFLRFLLGHLASSILACRRLPGRHAGWGRCASGKLPQKRDNELQTSRHHVTDALRVATSRRSFPSFALNSPS
jgi:hypothetical protein